MSVTPDTIRVLHVDDDPDLASVVATFLEREDERIEVVTATSAAEGCELLGEEPVDCVVSDYDMPGVNGIEFLDAVREEYPDLPFVLFTGKGSEEIASKAISAGVTDYLQKGAGAEQYALLANRIENAVERERSRRALEERKRRLETLVSNLPGIVYRCVNEPGWPMESVEGDCEDLVGYPAEALEAGRVSWGRDIIHPDDREAVWEAVQEAVAAGEPFEVTYRVVTADDEIRWMWERGRAVGTLDANGADDSGSESGANVDGEVAEGLDPDEDTTAGLDADGDATEAEPAALEGFITDITGRKEREEQLRDTTARLGALFDNSPDMIDVHDVDGTIREVNHRLCEKLGRDEEELVGSKVWEIDAAIDEAGARALWEEMSVGDRRRIDGRYRRADGSTFPVEVHVVQFELDGADRFLVVSRDVSERVAYEQELAERNRQFEAVLDTVSAGIFMKDTDGEYLVLNETAREWLGIDPDRDVSELSDETVFPPAIVEQVRADDRRVFEAGETVEIEEQLPLDDGERVLRTQKHPLYDDEGNPEAVCAVSTDITERKRREQRLRRYESMVSAMPAAACIYDAEGRFELVNDALAEWYDTTPEELEGQESGLVAKIREGHDGDPFAELVAGEREEFRGELEGEFPDHGYAVVDYHLTQLAIDGEFDGVVAVARDVTKRTRRERELERQNERLDEFVSVVSHDLRNPLTVANGRLELVREECDSDQVDAIERAHRQMEELIDDLLALAREGKAAIDPEHVSLSEIATGCWETVGSDDASLVVETDAAVVADRNRLAQLLENLFENAVTHGSPRTRSRVREDARDDATLVRGGENESDGDDEGDGVLGDEGDGERDDERDDDRDAAETAAESPALTITVGDLAGGTGFFVADDGVGIPREERDRVFETGYSTDEDGTGFGLGIVQRVAEAHGWEVSVYESADGGARFEVTGVRTVD